MQYKKQVTRFFIGRIMNGKFVCNGAIPISEYVEIDLIKRYQGVNRATQSLCIACHLIIISQNFAECKQYLKKKSIQILDADNHVETRRECIISTRGNKGACPLVYSLIASYISIRLNPWQKTQNEKI
jgi:hypothetical protein